MSKYQPGSVSAANNRIFVFHHLVVLLLAISFGALSACDEGNGRGGGGGNGGEENAPPEVASVEISPRSWTSIRMGQHRQFTATAYDADGNIIPDVDFTWESANLDVARVDATGLVTIYAKIPAGDPGGFTDKSITVSINGLSDSAVITVDQQVENFPGRISNQTDMYTAWPARRDTSPLLLINGSFRVKADIFCREEVSRNTWEDIVCPTNLNTLPENAPPYKFTGPSSPWTQGAVEKFQVLGDRMAILTDVVNGVGSLRVTERNTEWIDLAIATARDFQLEGNLIGVLLDSGELKTRSGIFGTWNTVVASGVRAFQLERNYIAVLRDDDSLHVLDPRGQWTEIEPANVKQFQLYKPIGTDPLRIGVLLEDGTFRVRDSLLRNWQDELTGVSSFQLEYSRIGVRLENNTCMVKNNINFAWSVMGTNCKKMQLEGGRIGVLNHDNRFYAKNAINDAWAGVASNIDDFQLQEDFIGVTRKQIAVSDEGGLEIESYILYVKEGLHGNWRNTDYYEGELNQFLLIADLRAPPKRTTPAIYRSGQTQCYNDDPVACEPGPVWGTPVYWYGRFCGKGNPSEEEFWEAFAAGPIDSLDYLCQHHDRASAWYPDETASAFQECVVRYGLDTARLTRNGRFVAEGSAEASSIWSRMPNLKSGVDQYVKEVDGCTISGRNNDMEEFVYNTKAKHNY